MQYFLKNRPIIGSNSSLDDSIFLYEIQKSSDAFQIINKELISFWNIIVNCLSGFLIRKGYENRKINIELDEISEKIDKSNMCYISLREIGRGSSASVELIYYIKMERIFALKIPFNDIIEQIEKERKNHLKFQIPFIVHYYGYFELNSSQRHVIYLIIEFIDGQTLDKYDLTKLNQYEKVNIVFSLLLTIKYIHSKKCVYRDLHLNNIIIDKNKEMKLIDLDRLIKIDEQETFDFNFENLPPEIKSGQLFTYKSDIYLVGCLMCFLLFQKKEGDNQKVYINVEGKNSLIYSNPQNFFYLTCLYIDPNSRPSLNSIIYQFYFDFLIKIPPQGKKEQDLIDFLEKCVSLSNEKKKIILFLEIYII